MRRTYLRPTAFVDRPSPEALSLAGGLCRFSAVEAITVEGGVRVDAKLIPIARLDSVLAHDPEAQATLARIVAPRAPLGSLTLDRPQVMAILNVTPDSFSDGGAHDDPVAAASAGLAMLCDGATLLDVGGESTRPGAATVPDEEEIARVIPVVRHLAAAGAPLSIDTRKAAVMAAALDAGAGLVNDVSALTYDPDALALVAARGCPVVLMHHQGGPETMQRNPVYGDVLIEVYDWLEARIGACEAAGIPRARILVDPGLGFGKRIEHNMALINGLSLFHGLGCAIVLGASRKRFIGALSNEAPVEARLGGSIATALLGAAQGVQLLRVHDAFQTVQALRVWSRVREAALGYP